MMHTYWPYKNYVYAINLSCPPTEGEGDLQSNLVNSKALGLEVLFRIISGMNNSEVDTKIHDRSKMILSVFFSTITFLGHVKETSP